MTERNGIGVLYENDKLSKLWIKYGHNMYQFINGYMQTTGMLELDVAYRTIQEGRKIDPNLFPVFSKTENKILRILKGTELWGKGYSADYIGRKLGYKTICSRRSCIGNWRIAWGSRLFPLSAELIKKSQKKHKKLTAKQWEKIKQAYIYKDKPLEELADKYEISGSKIYTFIRSYLNNIETGDVFSRWFARHTEKTTGNSVRTVESTTVVTEGKHFTKSNLKRRYDAQGNMTMRGTIEADR